MMFSVMILEDCKDSRTALETIIKGIAEDVHVFSVSSIKEARIILQNEVFINMFILDINLEQDNSSDKSGFIFAKEIRNDTRYVFAPIIFTTSMVELEAASFRETYCYRFIIKPYNKNKIISEVKKIMHHLGPKNEKQLSVKVEGINYRIKINDVVYIKAIPRGIQIVMTNESVNVKYTSIKQILLQINLDYFVQCHRMFVINLNYVDYVDLVNRMIKMNGYDEIIEIGVTYKNKLRSLMHE